MPASAALPPVYVYYKPQLKSEVDFSCIPLCLITQVLIMVPGNQYTLCIVLISKYFTSSDLFEQLLHKQYWFWLLLISLEVQQLRLKYLNKINNKSGAISVNDLKL